MSEFIELIKGNAYDMVIEDIHKYGNKISNHKDANGTSALMFATEIKPTMKAVEVINALMKSGASINKRDDKRRHVLLYVSEHGADPIVFDTLLNWNSLRNNILGKWWVQCDSEKMEFWFSLVIVKT